MAKIRIGRRYALTNHIDVERKGPEYGVVTQTGRLTYPTITITQTVNGTTQTYTNVIYSNPRLIATATITETLTIGQSTAYYVKDTTQTKIIMIIRSGFRRVH